MGEQGEMHAACARWLAQRYGWAPDPAQFGTLGDVNQGMHLAVYTCTEPGDGVLVQGPIYPPFRNSVETQGRRVVDNALIDPTGEARVDLDGLRVLAADPRTKLLLLCNPHNPSGRVLTRAELETIAEIALANDLIVVADEIWMDVVYPGHRHIPFQSLGPEIAARTVTFTSATKSFNLGGIRCAVMIFGSEALRERFDSLAPRIRSSPACMSVRATTAAWNEGGPWLDAVLRQLDANRQWVTRFVRERLPGVRQRMPEGTYLAWLDFGALDLGQPAAEFLLERARVGLNDGSTFGGFSQCARLNFATSPAILSEICERIAGAVA
jgi:cystathionine beta-lyase